MTLLGEKDHRNVTQPETPSARPTSCPSHSSLLDPPIPSAPRRFDVPPSIPRSLDPSFPRSLDPWLLLPVAYCPLPFSLQNEPKKRLWRYQKRRLCSEYEPKRTQAPLVPVAGAHGGRPAVGRGTWRFAASTRRPSDHATATRCSSACDYPEGTHRRDPFPALGLPTRCRIRAPPTKGDATAGAPRFLSGPVRGI